MLFAHIFAVLDRGDHAGIGRGAADAQLFHLFHQGGFGIAGGRLGEMLFGGDGSFCQGFRGHDLRQALVVFIDNLVAPLFVDLQKPVKQHNLARRAQPNLPILAANFYGGPLHPGGFHLAGDGALPNKVIQAALVGIGQFQRAGVFIHVCGADTFMRFLGIFCLVFIHARALGHVFGPEAGGNCAAGGSHGFGGHVDAIGAHIGDMACLVEALGGVHALACAHAEFAAGFLLQGRGHEWRRWVAAGGLGLDRLHLKVAAFHGLHRQFGLRFVGNIVFI